MPSHRKPRLTTVRKRARAVTLCAATFSAAAVPVMAQAATSSTTSTVKPAPAPKAGQHPAGKPKKTKPATKPTAKPASATTAGSTTKSDSSSASGETSYTVVSGDTLSGIAERALGDGEDYKKLFKLNKDRSEPNGGKLTDADLIDIGWTIELPSGSKSAVASTTSSSASSSSSSSSSSTTAETASTSSSASSSSSTSSDSSSASSSSTTSSSYADDLTGWIDEAISILSEHGYSVSYNAVYETAMNESSGNPDAENDSDSNAAEGNPSEGLMQTTQTTFDAYALSGYDDIWNPVDNIIAAAIYAQETYGGLDVVVADRCGGSCWSGY